MNKSARPYFVGLATGILGVVGVSYAQFGQVYNVPTEVVISNRTAIPVRVVYPIELNATSANPNPVTKPSEKWEYRTYGSADSLMDAMGTNNLRIALNKLGDDRWEMIAPYYFKRPKP